MKDNTIHTDKLETAFINGELYYKIANVNQMRSFFMSVVSDSNHWLFLSSNGGITAGRKNAQFALFPYYTDDKITESAETTGSKTIFQIKKENKIYFWEPFSIKDEDKFHKTNNLYQNKWGNKVIFEEINHELELKFTYEWCTSNEFGFVKKSTITNLSQNNLDISLVDGLQNILPYGIPSDLQAMYSNLVDAYKRTEIVADCGLGIFALSAIIVDRAEPAEALKANIVWSYGLDNITYLLSSRQLNNFKKNIPFVSEEDIKGEKGAYFISSSIILNASEIKSWGFVANVNQTQSNIISLAQDLKDKNAIYKKLESDINTGTQQLQDIAGAADGLQYTADGLKNTRHYFNVLFNLMRGGIFDKNYQIEKWDFELYLKKANKNLYKQIESSFNSLPNEFNLNDLKELVKKTDNNDFERLATEYLPLKFSRRHGDPSRPWNQFSINTKSEIDGSKILDYQGNWRDIFQNWEALVHSYPNFIEGMISKFLNATTFDGYNPYRVTKDGFDWETIEPDNPWSYIGYWGDHQIIYLLKFLEFAEKRKHGFFNEQSTKCSFVYANVPYKIKSYENIVKNAKDTIEFDFVSEKLIHERKEFLGADGALLTKKDGSIIKVNFIEKILATALSKISNFIPEGGIWMNTQRPEWNDANNALVGNGVSMVTLYYLRRFLNFIQSSLKNNNGNVDLSAELISFLNNLSSIFNSNISTLNATIDNKKRKEIVDALGTAGSNFRNEIYNNSFSGIKQTIGINSICEFINLTLQFIDHTIRTNKRKDNLYHAYNLLSFTNDELIITHLSEMLEGQVAVLSSGLLDSDEAIDLLDSLKNSALYRPDQNSYILYPNKQLPKFLVKNNIPSASVEKSILLKKLLENNNVNIIERDVMGGYHFNGNFKNADDLVLGLTKLDDSYQELVKNDKKLVLNIFEEVFNHKEFTGRSGTFFGYEGLGSIYWHMVSKLALAAQEVCFQAIATNTTSCIIEKLIKHYYEITDGIGIHKSPKNYGAFPVTPYSHTPLHKGAQQPGMTGQVKEDVLTRLGEMGIQFHNGRLKFNPKILLKNEFLTEQITASFNLVDGTYKEFILEKNSIAFTICQIPVIYTISEENSIEILFNNLETEIISDNILTEELSNEVFNRSGKISSIKVNILENTLI